MKRPSRALAFLRAFFTVGMLAVCLTVVGALLSPAYFAVLGWWQYAAWVAGCLLLAFVADRRRNS